ncbi:hypothetical protein CJD35_11465 [Sphingobium xenophagum]|uniref:Mu-like prophage FluMu N-terminal domain-containing protein n=1 Tax=Sphingobium xenophagum TaxID=121428 RepID=A0A249MV17_SPHXE|nr:hypothetical protein [Sphingobium xenophagum]ASY44989.1 hypothetical protein CJD35_11465 [Sphingobium xenophagum]
MKFIKLATAAHVNGVLRHPHEGVLHVTDEEAKRVIENDAALDVTDDFSDLQDAQAPAESITTDADRGAPSRRAAKPAADTAKE